ncbi:MAG: hypothetical protein ACYS5V_10825 [Planctomycetota bacterium]|jgi:hypothetical protein
MPIRPENLDRYPPDWPLISDRIRFERAEGRCECLGECGNDHGGRCAAEHNRRHPVTDSLVTLTTGHLDHQPENSDNPGDVFILLPLAHSNLRAWCQRCHLTHDREIHAANAAETRERQREQLRLI